MKIELLGLIYKTFEIPHVLIIYHIFFDGSLSECTMSTDEESVAVETADRAKTTTQRA
jgi:hypothetical protein